MGFLLFIFSFAVAIAMVASTCSESDTVCMAKKALKYTNDYRASKGKGPLLQNKVLMQLAQSWSRTMHDTNNFNHQQLRALTGPPNTFVSAENIARGNTEGDDMANQVVTGWINSPGHERNIMSDSTHIGFGFYRGTDNEWYSTQVFAQCMSGDMSGCPASDSYMGEQAAVDTSATESPSPAANNEGPPATSNEEPPAANNEEPPASNNGDPPAAAGPTASTSPEATDSSEEKSKVTPKSAGSNNQAEAVSPSQEATETPTQGSPQPTKQAPTKAPSSAPLSAPSPAPSQPPQKKQMKKRMKRRMTQCRISKCVKYGPTYECRSTIKMRLQRAKGMKTNMMMDKKNMEMTCAKYGMYFKMLLKQMRARLACRRRRRKVCGSNGKTYRNRCRLYLHSFYKNFSIQMRKNGSC